MKLNGSNRFVVNVSSTLFLSNERDSESKSQKKKQKYFKKIVCLQKSRLANEVSCSTMPSGKPT